MGKNCVIGIDIGGTNIRIGHTDEAGELADFERISSKETFKDGIFLKVWQKCWKIILAEIA